MKSKLFGLFITLIFIFSAILFFRFGFVDQSVQPYAIMSIQSDHIDITQSKIVSSSHFYEPSTYKPNTSYTKKITLFNSSQSDQQLTVLGVTSPFSLNPFIQIKNELGNTIYDGDVENIETVLLTFKPHEAKSFTFIVSPPKDKNEQPNPPEPFYLVFKTDTPKKE